MSNPFPSRFDSTCNSCGETVYEGDDMYAVDGQFVCQKCAEENGNVCPNCGNYKDEKYETCYECHEGEETEDTILDDEDDMESGGVLG